MRNLGGAFIAVDPGRRKCGVALMDMAGRVFEKGIVELEDFAGFLKEIREKNAVMGLVVVGDGTGKAAVVDIAQGVFGGAVEVRIVKETDTTIIARRKYFEENPPRLLMRLLPAGLRVPPRPVDDFAAVVIGEIYIKEQVNL